MPTTPRTVQCPATRSTAGQGGRWHEGTKLKTERYAPSNQTTCPHCRNVVRFYRFSGMGDVAPHFYCNTCSNVYWSETHARLVRERAASPELLAEIERTLPDCPCGGHFKSGANPKCPHCGTEMPHQHGPVPRLSDPYAIVVDGALLVTDGNGCQQSHARDRRKPAVT